MVRVSPYFLGSFQVIMANPVDPGATHAGPGEQKKSYRRFWCLGRKFFNEAKPQFFFMEGSIWVFPMDDLGVPIFSETPI